MPPMLDVGSHATKLGKDSGAVGNGKKMEKGRAGRTSWSFFICLFLQFLIGQGEAFVAFYTSKSLKYCTFVFSLFP